MKTKTEKMEMICIVCPLGCKLEASQDEDGRIQVKGFRCPKGNEYAKREISDPRRILMMVVRVRGGHLPVVSVKTAEPIPKNVLRDAVAAVSEIEISAPVKAGDPIVDDLLDTGVPVVATNNIRKIEA